MLKVQEFLQNHSLQELEKPPYNLIIKENDNLVLLKYNQVESDFNEEICKECRGIILEKDTWKVVCFPFYKFFNYGEQFAAKLSNNIHIYQKVDGSLAKLFYYNNQWILASNGNIDGKEIELNGKNFFQLFCRALSTYGLNFDKFVKELNTNRTYMYELATQDNRVVIQYSGYHLFYLGERDNISFQEYYNQDSRIENVKVYNFSSLDKIIHASNELPDSEEGYVVRDDKWNRVKVKNPIYFELHHRLNNGKPNFIKMILENDQEEFLSYFPRYREEIEKISRDIQNIEKTANYYKELLKRENFSNKKEYVQKVNEMQVPCAFRDFIFKNFNEDVEWKEYVSSWHINKWKEILS